MQQPTSYSVLGLCSYLRTVFSGPQILAFLPAVVLVGFWVGGEALLLTLALGLPLCMGVLGLFAPNTSLARHRSLPRDDRAQLGREIDVLLREARQNGRRTACLMVEIDDFHAVLDRYGQAAADTVIHRCFERIERVLRAGDHVCLFRPGQIAVAIGTVPRLDLEAALQLAARLQAAVEEPVALDAITVYVSASVGFCLDQMVGKGGGDAMIRGADLALQEALRHGPSALRAYSPEMREPETCPQVISDELTRALENGEIQAWFQPQVSTETGQVTGFEALARWVHPERGVIAPAEFLPDLTQSGRMEKLCDLMLTDALKALKSWDARGFQVPKVGVNFAPDELRNPRLLDKVEWQLDRFDLTADRLAVEILETVVATSPDDVISRNINGLANLGCCIDLDDFGTGHASISSIRRFAVQRLKIDRSFVMKVDRDSDQQRMVSAILLMTERLELDSLAEGVETASEHAMLAQLGCRHVQGFGIARPMPLEQTYRWISSYLDTLEETPVIGRTTG